MLYRFYVAPDHYGPENIEDGSVAEGNDAEDALERHIESHMADYDYATELDMLVRAVDGGEVSRFEVTVTAVPSAWARRI